MAKAINILGIQAVLAILFCGVPRTGRGGRMNIGKPPPRTPGIRYQPTTKSNPSLYAGEGRTSFWGDAEISSRGTAKDRG
jgi:hypothetical protein